MTWAVSHVLVMKAWTFPSVKRDFSRAQEQLWLDAVVNATSDSIFLRVLLCVFVVFCVSVYSVYCLSSMDLCGLN